MIAILDEMEKIFMIELADKMTSLNASLQTDLVNSSMLQNELKRLSEAIHDTVQSADKGKAELAYIASKKGAVLIQKSETYLKEKYVEVKRILPFQANTDVQQYLSKLSGLARIRKSAATTKPKVLPDVVLHKAENAWKPGHLKPRKDADVDEATELYKKTRSILNKLTPQTFQVLISKMKQNALKIDTESKLQGVIDIVFEKAISESNYSSDSNPNEKVNFRAVLLSRCQREFENDKSSEAGCVNNLVHVAKCDNSTKKVELKQTLEPNESKAKNKSLGNVRFVGELFKVKMLTENIMHDCLVQLFRSKNLECFCMLLSTIGKELDSDRSRPRMNQYFELMAKIVNDKKKPAKVRFMLQDVIDLRKKNWIKRRIANNSPSQQRDRFVCGIKDEAIQKKLLSIEELTLNRAIDISIAMETATRDAAELQTSNAGSNVNRVKKTATRPPKNKKYTHKSRSRST
ncbi:eukaryotic translation initiation factor 4 gamma 1-like [Dreissena polymorpha]|uniref:eukaryotic translation initiation factor 4 gamma 1-like n=1 Tax=Dreissena polymorpha TaxID=45954 RepID=UPI0022648835|nr:eukaryotic translation initiation factor 4 gamma 1-like [Dreissena polymorpha]